ncbi:MAG: hypothetical protein AAF665_03405 [Pseudomonadota bacterium]
MSETQEQEVLARLAASGARRIMGIGMLAFLAILVLYVAVVSPPALGWQVFLVVLGSASLMIAQAMWKATAATLELTRAELRDDTGTVIVRLDDVESVDRGAFAFKPSNGFLLRLKSPHARAWRPGLWWRSSHRIGVGGMTPLPPAKHMADAIAVLLAERDGG